MTREERIAHALTLIRKPEVQRSFSSGEEYRHVHPNRETRPLSERLQYPDYMEQKRKKEERWPGGDYPHRGR
jgi:hypothetical protein